MDGPFWAVAGALLCATHDKSGQEASSQSFPSVYNGPLRSCGALETDAKECVAELWDKVLRGRAWGHQARGVDQLAWWGEKGPLGSPRRQVQRPTGP